ncbi:S8 family serine peptidase [Kribbella sp. NPDC051587]|uniref:S8 family serine peptidase n=1 Tax=Kribbella sp. NPDC051587 TaxID=3364119 RepID=UPI00379584F3
MQPASLSRLNITLITGDKVTVARQGDSYRAVSVQPGTGRAGMGFHKFSAGDKQLVVPLDATALVAAGVVDQRLFDVNLLATLGLDDTSAPRLPLLLHYDSANPSARSELPVGAKFKRQLPIVDAVAIGQERAQASHIWSTWLNSQRAKRKSGLAGGVKKVSLDGGARPNLDRSVPQIGAPAAWKAGFTGKGVKVAVLDTGYDATHPDLNGRVVTTKGFAPKEDGTVDDKDVLDTEGHGTHVASIVAGTGAASDGKYRGVAPDADLMIGKVCGTLDCEDSSIIAGMEWAANSGARVVNMSLGGAPTDGTDVLSEALNKLTARTGTLFVVSGGNFGEAGSIGSPATADAALAVASVTKGDTHSLFSSSGPRYGDLAVKPDISAPGSRIIAARAANTPLAPYAINDSYAELSGTSMAAPHIAGAAALLAQQHPDWKAAELKSALMGSSVGLPKQDIYTQGAGRADLAQAVKQNVLAMPSSLNLGLQPAPHNDDKPITKSVTYVNTGERPVHLTLRLDGPGIFRLNRTSLDIPAHGSSQVDVTATTSGPEVDGGYGAWLIADGNGSPIRTTVGVGKAVPTHPHTLTMTDFGGRPGLNDDDHTSDMYLFNPKTTELYHVLNGATANIPSGHYVLDGAVSVFDHGVAVKEATYFLEGDLAIGDKGPIVLDGRRAVRLGLRQPVKGATSAAVGLGAWRTVGDRSFGGSLGLDTGATTLYVAPNRTGSPANYTVYANALWTGVPAGTNPIGQYLDSPYVYYDAAFWRGLMPSRPAVATTPSGYARVNSSYAGEPGYYTSSSAYPIDPRRGANGLPLGLAAIQPATTVSLPHHRDEFYSTNVEWAFGSDIFEYNAKDGQHIQSSIASQPVALPAGRTTEISRQRGVFGPTMADRRAGDPDLNASPWVSRDGDSLDVGVPNFGDGVPSDIGHALASERTTLYRDGQELRSTDTADHQVFALPPALATYRLKKVIRPAVGWTKLSTEITSEWTFRSERTPDGPNTPVPLLNVRYSPKLDDRNRANGGKFDFPVTVQTAFQADAKPITSLDLTASFDDGTTWQKVQVSRTGTNTWKAELDQPSTGFVTLRAVAVDSGGNQVDQTVKRAYELK